MTLDDLNKMYDEAGDIPIVFADEATGTFSGVAVATSATFNVDGSEEVRNIPISALVDMGNKTLIEQA